MTSNIKDTAARTAVLTAIANFAKDLLTVEKGGDLRDGMVDLRQTAGAKTIDVDLPGLGKVGRVTLPEIQNAVRVTNDRAYAEYMEANHPGSTEWVLVVKPAVQEKHLKTLAEGADWETGEAFDLALAAGRGGEAPKVAGVTAQKGEGFGTPTVTVSKADQARIIDAVRSRPLLELTAAVASDEPVFDDSKIVDVEVVHTAESLKPLKRPELVDLCHRQGLDHVGTLPALRQRILDAQAAADDTAADVA